MSTVKVLVVEDNKESRQIVKDVLEANGFSVETAADGEIGLNKVRFAEKQKEPYNICITDVMLPKVSGIDLLKRSHEIAPDMGVIVISAFDEVDPFIKKDAIRSGAYSFLSKPIEPAKLLKSVNEFLAGKKIRKTSGSQEEGTVPFFGTLPSQKRQTASYMKDMDDIPPPPELPEDGGEDAPPPPPSLDEEHITRPVPDAEHFKDISDTDELEEDKEYPFVVARCPMCSHMIKIAKDGVSGKIWCSNCGILFDREDTEFLREDAAGTEQEGETPPPLPDDIPQTGQDDSSEPVGPSAEDTDEAVEEELTVRQETAPQAEKKPGKGKLKLLIVEDDMHTSEILETALDVAGYSTDTADTGGKAFAMISESISSGEPYDLVICDVMIPEINGLDLMIKVNETRSGINFILVSAYEDENLSLQKQAEEEGALTFFSKPYDYKDLISFIKKYAENE